MSIWHFIIELDFQVCAFFSPSEVGGQHLMGESYMCCDILLNLRYSNLTVGKRTKYSGEDKLPGFHDKRLSGMLAEHFNLYLSL